MLVAVSFFRAGSHHRDMPHAERFSSLLAIRAVTMVDGLPRAASLATWREKNSIYEKSNHSFCISPQSFISLDQYLSEMRTVFVACLVMHFRVYAFEARLYESSRAVIMVDGLPRAASSVARERGDSRF